MSRLLSPEELEALRTAEPYVPAPTERYHVVAEAGHADLTPEEVAALAPGSLIALDRRPEDPVEIVANATPVARGVLVNVNGRVCVRVMALAASRTETGRKSR
jgi:flagellar motor switch/type III secretory pathway protein FliN